MKIVPTKCYEVNSDNIKILARRVCRDYNIHTLDRFTPVRSRHILPLTENRRIVLDLNDTEFIKEEQFRDLTNSNGWKTMVEMRVSGKPKEIENEFLASIKGYMKRLAAINELNKSK